MWSKKRRLQPSDIFRFRALLPSYSLVKSVRYPKLCLPSKFILKFHFCLILEPETERRKLHLLKSCQSCQEIIQICLPLRNFHEGVELHREINMYHPFLEPAHRPQCPTVLMSRCILSKIGHCTFFVQQRALNFEENMIFLLEFVDFFQLILALLKDIFRTSEQMHFPISIPCLKSIGQTLLCCMNLFRSLEYWKFLNNKQLEDDALNQKMLLYHLTRPAQYMTLRPVCIYV